MLDIVQLSLSEKSYFLFGLEQIAVMVEQCSLPDSVQISKNLIFFASSLFWKPFWVNTCLRGNMHCNGGDGIYVLFDGISDKSNLLIYPYLIVKAQRKNVLWIRFYEKGIIPKKKVIWISLWGATSGLPITLQSLFCLPNQHKIWMFLMKNLFSQILR